MGFFSRLFGASEPEPQPTPAPPTPAPVPAAPEPSAAEGFAPSGNEATPAVSQERIISIFKSKGWRYFIDDEGDLGGIWDDNQFYFILAGKMHEILHIIGRYQTTIPMEKLDAVREFNLDWNRDKLWPKVYHRINDEGEIRAMAENIVDWEPGASDAQLLQQINCALGTANQYFNALASEVLGQK